MVRITVGYLKADFVQFKAEKTDCNYYKGFFATIVLYYNCCIFVSQSVLWPRQAERSLPITPKPFTKSYQNTMAALQRWMKHTHPHISIERIM